MHDKSSHPLKAWLNRQQPLPERFYAESTADQIDGSWNCWVAIEERLPFHHADTAGWTSLKESREKTDEYLTSAGELIGGLKGAWLDSEEAELLQEELGDPPPPCLPVYIIGLEGEGDLAGPVYVGITRSNNRFAGGHKAALHLHDPKYEDYSKYLYRAAVWFLCGNDYLPLEWLRPDDVANEILESIESQLIYEWKPAINVRKKKTDRTSIPLEIQVENFSGDEFVKDYFIFP